LSDTEVLAFAASAGRVLVTHDLKTMPKYFAEFIMNQQSNGVIVISQKLSIRAVIDD